LAQADCIIVGSGIAGLATALALCQNGLNVTVIERQSIGREASWAGGGIVCPLYGWRYPEPVMRLAALGMAAYPQFIETLGELSAIDPEYHPSGMLILDPHSQKDQPAEILDWASRHQITAELSAARAHFPHLSEREALWLPTIHNTRNPRLLKALTEAVTRAGVQLVEQTAVQHVLIENRQVTGVQTAAGTRLAPCVLVTAGAWSGSFAPGLTPTTVFPVRGQMLRFDHAPANGLSTILMEDGVYLIPRCDGSVIVGSTVEHVGFDKHTTDEAIQRLHRKAIALWPNLVHAPVTHQWSGLRPGTADEIPYLGAHPEIKGLFIGTGFYRNGLAMAPAVATLMTDLILSRPNSVDLSAYRVDRAVEPRA